MRTIHWRDIVQPGEAFHLARRQMQGRHPCPPHDHDFAEIFWLEQGVGVQVVNGVRQRLEAGDLQLIRPADAHEYFSDRPAGTTPYTLVNVAMPWETITFLRDRYFADEPQFFGGDQLTPAQFRLAPAQIRQWHQAVIDLSLAPRRPVLIERFLLNLLHELRQQTPAPGTIGALPALVLADTTFDSTLDSGRGDGLAATVTCPAWLRHACEQIRQPAHFLGGTRRFAELCSRSPEHVAREMRRCFGITPTEVLNRARLAHAASELALSAAGILEIALGCGFSSLAHFYGLFRRQYGMSPRQYRLKSQAAVR